MILFNYFVLSQAILVDRAEDWVCKVAGFPFWGDGKDSEKTEEEARSWKLVQRKAVAMEEAKAVMGGRVD